MSVGERGILRRMSHIYDMYRMVKITRKQTNKNERTVPSAEQLSGFESRHAATLNVKKQYIKFRPWLTAVDASHVAADTLTEKYIEGVTYTLPHHKIAVDTLCVQSKGRKLIERTWLIFPTGLWAAWYEENGKVFLALMLSVVTILTAIVGLLAKIVFFNN